MTTTKLDPSETLFLRFIGGYTSENLRDAITMDVDLGKLVLEEFAPQEGEPDILAEGRKMASLYDATHPKARGYLADPMESAKRVLEFLKVQRPDLGYEIETYVSLPTASSIGLVMVGEGGNNNNSAAPVSQPDHAGMTWLAKNIISLANVLLVG